LRYLELAIAPVIARDVFEMSAYWQILTAMSHLGILFGVAPIFLSDHISTPIPYLRLGALLLPLVWIFPFLHSDPRQMVFAWRFGSILIPISLGWALGEYSLSQFMQESLPKERIQDDSISTHGAITSFLYVSHIILYTILSTSLGKYIDAEFNRVGTVKTVLIFIGGVQFSILAVVLFANTFISKNAFTMQTESEERGHRRGTNYYSVLYAPVPTDGKRTREKEIYVDRAKLMSADRYE
jgi:hypothetical protein